MKRFWSSLGLFWKVYLSAVTLTMTVVVIADLTEDFIPYLVRDKGKDVRAMNALMERYVKTPEHELPALRDEIRASGVWVMDIPVSSLYGWNPGPDGVYSVLDTLPPDDDWESDWTMVERILPDGRMVVVGKPDAWIYDALEWVMWFLLIAAFAGVSCYWLFNFIMSRLHRISGAVKSLAQGDLSVRLPVEGDGGDELSDLSRTFNRMAGSIEELMRNERRLLYDISHEMRTPLARMYLALDLAKRSGPEKSGEYMEMLTGDMARIGEMVEGIMEQGKGFDVMNKLLLEPLDLCELLREVAELANHENKRVGHSARCLAATRYGQKILLNASRNMLEQAFYNVMSNALRYAPANSLVDIGVSVREADAQGGRRAVVFIRDYGPGVPDDCLEKLFRPFFRVENARDKHSGGVGLGLALTNTYVRRHSGSIRACNADPGLRVEITLPLPDEGEGPDGKPNGNPAPD